MTKTKIQTNLEYRLLQKVWNNKQWCGDECETGNPLFRKNCFAMESIEF